VRWDKVTARLIDDLGNTAHGRRDDRKCSGKGLHEDDPERLRPEVRLAEDISRSHELRHIAALAEELDAALEA
jgi:hypothetical protein